jgi:IMP dehydrogenase
MKEMLTFEDILLVPQYSEIKSRSDVSLNVRLSNLETELRIPVVSSPMDTVTEHKMAAAIHASGGLGIIHRYNSIEKQVNIVTRVLDESIDNTNVGVAVGVTGDFEERACAAHDAGANVLCVDIAHGHHILMKNALRRLRDIFGNDIHIMAGNIATLRGFNDLSDWGADSIRVGVGGGSICSTRIMTGHGVPTLQSVLDCAKSDRDTILIADGGIKQTGDIVKAIAAGADLVMLGSMLAGTDETPGDAFYVDGVKNKAYRGMASSAAQIDWRGHVASEEGVSHQVISKGPVTNVLDNIEKAIRSGMSYSGAKSLACLRAKADLIKVTQASIVESRPHILQS